uniref:Uncharacterized protein n=1 Tax=Vitis vinifera TaxID=29760 RepID=A5B012_VITVI|nr:hypothetical protein VITISV_022453 [Vitis vinifera]
MSLFGKGLLLRSMGKGLSCGRPSGVGTLFVEEPFSGNHGKKEVEDHRQQLAAAKRHAESIAVITPVLEKAFLEVV